MKNSLILFVSSFLLFAFLYVGGVKAKAIGKPILSNGFNRSCMAHEQAIKTRMTHLTRLATTMEETFGKIAMRAENFYVNKVIPSGKTVSNYNGLVADIATQKNAVTTSLAKAQTDANAFSCVSGSVKAQMTMFRIDMQNVKQALKTYRTSIKTLIVAVHSVVGDEESAVSATPEPTK